MSSNTEDAIWIVAIWLGPIVIMLALLIFSERKPGKACDEVDKFCADDEEDL